MQEKVHGDWYMRAYGTTEPSKERSWFRMERCTLIPDKKRRSLVQSCEGQRQGRNTEPCVTFRRPAVAPSACTVCRGRKCRSRTCTNWRRALVRDHGQCSRE